MSISDRDNDLYVVTDQPGTDLAQRGLCAAEIRVKTKPNVKKIEVDPLDVFSRAAPKRPHEVCTGCVYVPDVCVTRCCIYD